MITTIPIMHCFDDRYSAPAAVAFLSLLEHASKDYRYAIYVAHRDISEAHQKMLQEVVGRFENATLEFIRMEGTVRQTIKDLFASLDEKGHYAEEVVYKVLAPRIFPQHSRIVIADVDVLYQDDISVPYREFEKDNENYLAAVPWNILPFKWLETALDNCYAEGFGPEDKKACSQGICAGFMIFNLDLMRRDGFVDKTLGIFRTNAHRLKQAEQDAINLATFGRQHALSARHMVCSYLFDHVAPEERAAWEPHMKHPFLLHYVTDVKPWNSPGSAQAHLWWATLCRTPFYYEVAEPFDSATKISICKLFGFLRIAKIWHTGALSKVRFINAIPMSVEERR